MLAGMTNPYPPMIPSARLVWMGQAVSLGVVLALAGCGSDGGSGVKGLVGGDVVAPTFDVGSGAPEAGVIDTGPVDGGLADVGGSDPDPGPDTPTPEDAGGPPPPDDTGIDAVADTAPPVEPDCVVAADCAESGGTLSACEAWICTEAGSCAVILEPDLSPCTTASGDGLCAAGECAMVCGDGIVQATLGEQCDDGANVSGDGCRDDCVVEEPIGAGFTGGQCQADAECAPPGSFCIDGVGGGSCSVPCDLYCDDEPPSPVTFCISAEVYESRMEGPLPAGLLPAMCVSKCDYALFARTGCRAGLHCEQRNRYQTSVRDEVCVPGPWAIGLALSPDGGQVLGLEASEPEPAEPYSRLLTASCSGVFEPVDAGLFEALTGTLLAMGGDGHDEDWERLCSAAGLPALYGIGAEAANGDAFRLVGSRLDIVSWTAAGIYGSKSAAGALVGGPLFGARAMVHRSGSAAYLYADAADDFPYVDPERRRHFGLIDGKEWGPLDAEIAPNAEFVTIKSDGTARFYRQWGRIEYVVYLADMALDHLAQHAVPLGIGDMSLPTGGDIDGHASHEKGVDVDIYLLTFDATPSGAWALDAPKLWVAACTSSGGWDCWYHEDKTGVAEDFSDPNHVPAASMLTTLAWFAYDHTGPTHFVQHDVTVLSDFAALPGNLPTYIDASNADAQGWPPHKNHVHIRFAK